MKKILEPFSILSNANFRWLSIGVFISFIGSQMQVVAISWHVYQLTKSAYYLGFIGLAGFFPMLFFSTVSGLLIDAFDRKRIILIDQILLAAVNGSFAVLTFLHYDSLIILFAVIICNAFITIIDIPARQSIIPSIVPKSSLIHALNVNTIFRQTALIIGPAIAGFVIAEKGVSAVYFSNALSFLLCFLAVLRIHSVYQPERKPVPVSIVAAIEGIKFIKSSPILYATILLDFFANFFAASTVIFPIFATQILHVGAKELGFLYAAPSFGAVITGLLIGTVSHVRQQGKLLLWIVALYAAATIGFGVSRWLNLSLFFLAIVGGADMISMVIRATIAQIVTPDHIRGRMNAINFVFLQGGPFLGEAEAGFLAGLFGGPVSVIIGGFGAILSVVGISVFVPSLGKYIYQHHEFEKVT